MSSPPKPDIKGLMIMHTHKHTHTHTKIHIHIHINTHPPYNASQRTLHQTLPAQGGHENAESNCIQVQWLGLSGKGN